MNTRLEIATKILCAKVIGRGGIQDIRTDPITALETADVLIKLEKIAKKL